MSRIARRLHFFNIEYFYKEDFTVRYSVKRKFNTNASIAPKLKLSPGFFLFFFFFFSKALFSGVELLLKLLKCFLLLQQVSNIRDLSNFIGC